MRQLLPLLIFTTLIAGCSCQRPPSSAESAPADAAPAQTAQSPSPPESDQRGHTGGDEDTPPSLAMLSRGNAASTVHSYLQALVQVDKGDPDGFWSGGLPPPQPDDAVLRSLLPDIRSLRINNDAAIALDRELPPRSMEIPVRLRIGTDAGPRVLHGWYRVRQRVDGSGWEITSASLQPVLD